MNAGGVIFIVLAILALVLGMVFFMMWASGTIPWWPMFAVPMALCALAALVFVKWPAEV